MRQLGVRDFVYALAAHALLFGLLAISVHFGSVTDQAAPGTEKAVQAVAVEDIPTQEEPDESDDDAAEAEAQAQAEAEAQAAEQARREAQAQAAEQARREAAEQAQREAAEQARLEAQAQAQREAEAEAEAAAAAAEQARREAEAAEQARREAEAAEQARREAAERARREAAEQAEREAAEQARREAEQRAERVAQARGTFDGAIRQKIERAWNRPASVPAGLSCVVAVRLGPGGSVLSARVVQSSGNTAFDQSAERAVFRADPLPMPDEAMLAAPYRQGVELVFNPDE